MYKIITCIFAFICATSSTTFAQSEISLEDVLISAYKMDIPFAQSSSAYLITSKDLEKNSYGFVVDALHSVPGITITQNAGLGGTASVYIRGSKTGNMIVLIDGVKVNDPSNIERSFDFGTLLPDFIERIEIIKGPQSVLYGSDATGGIINIITKKGDGKTTMTINSAASSFYTTKVSGNIAGGNNTMHYSLTMGQISSEGYSKAAKPVGVNKPYDNDSFHQEFAMGRFGFSPLNVMTFEIGLTAKKSKVDIDDGAFLDDPTSYENRKELSGYVRAFHTITDFWKHSITFDGATIKRIYEDIDDDGDTGFLDFGNDNSYLGRNIHGEWLHTFSIQKFNTLLIGISYEKELYKYDDELFQTSRKNDTWYGGFFAHDHLELTKMLFITAGIRADHHEVFGWHRSYNASFTFIAPIIKTKLKGNWGKGYKAPSLYQIYGDGAFVIENKNIKSEDNMGFDVGIEQPLFNIATIGISYFQNNYKNMIEAKELSPTQYQYLNIGKVRTNGIEMIASIKPFEFLAIRGGYTYLEAIDENTDEQLLRRPKHQASGTIELLWQRVDISLNGVYVGKRKDAYYDSTTFQTVNVNNESYFKSDVTIQYKIHEKLTIAAKAENITNKEYQHVVGYQMPQRTYSIEVKGIF